METNHSRSWDFLNGVLYYHIFFLKSALKEQFVSKCISYIKSVKKQHVHVINVSMTYLHCVADSLLKLAFLALLALVRPVS